MIGSVSRIICPTNSPIAGAAINRAKRHALQAFSRLLDVHAEFCYDDNGEPIQSDDLDQFVCPAITVEVER